MKTGIRIVAITLEGAFEVLVNERLQTLGATSEMPMIDHVIAWLSGDPLIIQ